MTKRINRKRSPQAAQARAELIALSKVAQESAALMAATTGEKPTVNEILLMMYKEQTGCNDFRRFNEWKAAGYKVKKGEKAFRVWGAPIRAKKASEDSQADDAKEGEGEDSSYKHWPMCCLFNESQVEPMNDDGPKGDKDKSSEADDPQGDAGESAEAIKESEKETVKVAIFRQRIEHLERVFNVDRCACVDAREFTNWMTICRRVLETLEATTCARAKPEDWERYTAIIETVRAFLAAPPEPPKPRKRRSDEADASPFVNPHYAEQLEARRERLEYRAAAAEAASVQQYSAASRMAEVIPFGQPILVGHHSEKSDRRYRGKIENKYRQSVELSQKAEHYEQKAKTVGKGGVSSSDPEAIEKLSKKLAKLEETQQTMKEANRLIRRGDIEALGELGFTTEQAQELAAPDFSGRVGFPPYALQNNNAEIRRIKQRIKSLEALRNSEPLEYENDDFRVFVEEGRVVFDFTHGKPSDEARTILKSAAFKFSRRAGGLWVRKATHAAMNRAEDVIKSLEGLGRIY